MDTSNLPRSGDHLFQILSERTPRSSEGRWLEYARSYKRAADALVVEAARDTQVPEVDSFPVVFLYRHYLELELKSIVALDCVLRTVREQRDDATKRVVEACLRSHNLIRLVDACREACTRASLLHDGFVESFQAFAACVGEIASHDPGSFAFRYPVDKKLKPTLRHLERIDLQHLKSMIDKMGCFASLIRHSIQQNLESLDAENDWTEDDEVRHFKDITGIDESEAVIEGSEN
jgi:hypothetical protein